MHWLEVAGIVFGLLGFFAIGGVLAFRVYRNPFLLAGLLPVIWDHVKPALIRHVVPLFLNLTKRMPPEEEAEWRDCQKRGGRWNHHTRRCE